MSERTDKDSDATVERAANLFDLRRIIGGLFLLYGLILFLLGLFESDAKIEKAAGVNVNLWTGLAMLVVGALFIAWALLRPLGTEIAESSQEGGRGARRDRDRPGGDADAGRE